MKRRIHAWEMYPVYDLSDTDGRWREIPDDLKARYDEAKLKWFAVQDELESLYDAEDPKDAQA